MPTDYQTNDAFLARNGRKNKQIRALFLTVAKRQDAASLRPSVQRGPESAGRGIVDAKRTRPRPSERPRVGGVVVARRSDTLTHTPRCAMPITVECWIFACFVLDSGPDTATRTRVVAATTL